LKYNCNSTLNCCHVRNYIFCSCLSLLSLFIKWAEPSSSHKKYKFMKRKKNSERNNCFFSDGCRRSSSNLKNGTIFSLSILGSKFQILKVSKKWPIFKCYFFSGRGWPKMYVRATVSFCVTVSFSDNVKFWFRF